MNNGPPLVSIVGLVGWLVLVLAGLRARQLKASKAVMYGLIWGAIFFAAAAFFGAVG